MNDPILPSSAVPESSPHANAGIAAASTVPHYPTGEPVTPPEALPGRATASARTRPYLRAPATYLLLGINIVVFVLMVWRGSSINMPTEQTLLRFGANNAELVLGAGQWWRIVTAMFVHVGVVHLATNMWCLWNLGLLGEPLLGFFGVLAVYLLTGAAGNLLSTVVNVLAQNDYVVGAGASGAVFGIAGILIVLLSNSRLAVPRGGNGGVPLAELRALRRSVINFAGINLAIGLFSAFQSFLPVRIDNMAHVGGFLSGLVLGVPLLSAMTLGRARYLARQRIVFAGGVWALVLVCVWLNRLAK